MDTFIDKLASKRNAQEMIRANSTAETLKMNQLEGQVAAYDELLQEIRKVNLKTSENADKTQSFLQECLEKAQTLQNTEASNETKEQTYAEMKELLEELFKQSDDFQHKENVKVYRNVQAVLVEELEKQNKVINDQLQEMKESLSTELSAKKTKGNTAVLVFTILTFIGVLADIGIHVAVLLLEMAL